MAAMTRSVITVLNGKITISSGKFNGIRPLLVDFRSICAVKHACPELSSRYDYSNLFIASVENQGSIA